MLVIVLLSVVVVVAAVVPSPKASDESELLSTCNECVRAVLEVVAEPSCSLTLLTDGYTSTASLTQVGLGWERRQGLAIMETTNPSDDNTTLPSLATIITHARSVRQRSWCSVVVVVSESPTFLARVAERSLKGRLLVWSTKMLVVTRLALHHLLSLLPSHWTFSMMNTVVLNLEHPRPNTRCVMYSYLPYSGGVVQVAAWTSSRGLQIKSNRHLFQQKYNNFNGAVVNVTARPFMPYWGEEVVTVHDDLNGTSVVRYTGSDYYLLQTIATTLNFTFIVLPTSSWTEVTDLVRERTSFICSVFYMLLVNRAAMYDYTTVHEFSYHSFAMGKPGLRPQWQSVYYPLTQHVWILVAAAIIICPVVMYLLSCMRQRFLKQHQISGTLGDAVQDMFGMLLGQDLRLHLPLSITIRILVLTWMMFTIIFSASYRGNLTAVLTLPKFPPRPETLSQLVSTAERVTIPPYGEQHRRFYQNSDSPVYNALAELMIVGPTFMQGLRTASQVTAQLGSNRLLRHKISESFTEADGSTKLYVGREPLFPGPAGFPIPHDAPYKQQFDWCIRAAIEAGLNVKWVSNISRQTVLESQRRQKQQTSGSTKDNPVQESEGDNLLPALTITHIQGPFIILLLGFVLGSLALMVEILWFKML